MSRARDDYAAVVDWPHKAGFDGHMVRQIGSVAAILEDMPPMYNVLFRWESDEPCPLCKEKRDA